MIKCAIVTIGDELLYGNIEDTNATWMSQEMTAGGAVVCARITVGDSIADIHDALDLALNKAEVVVLTGGLGPTQDDKTREAIAKYCNRPLVRDEALASMLEKHFAPRGPRVVALNDKLAWVCEGSEILPNAKGTAVGTWVEEDRGAIISLPGVPYEMKVIMQEEVMPRIRSRYDVEPLVVQWIMTAGQGESSLSVALEDIELGMPDEVTLAYLPSLQGVRLRLTSPKTFQSESETIAQAIEERLGHLVYAKGNTTLSHTVHNLLLAHEKTLVLAESCTGGNIMATLVKHAGSSQYLLGGHVVYSNQWKQNEINVSKELIASYGAVSEEVARSMAEGAKANAGADIALAVTGIAGPGGGSMTKPVGTVHIALCYNEVTYHKKFKLHTDRAVNIALTTTLALNMIRLALLGSLEA